MDLHIDLRLRSNMGAEIKRPPWLDQWSDILYLIGSPGQTDPACAVYECIGGHG